MRVVRRRERRAQNRERVVSKLNVLARWNRARLEDRRGERFSFVERRGGRRRRQERSKRDQISPPLGKETRFATEFLE